MEGTLAIRVLAENSDLSISQSPYLVSMNPGFLNMCYINLPYGRFSTKKCCHTLAMEQINFDKFYIFHMAFWHPLFGGVRFSAMVALSSW
jgi:hypothetical protein